MAGRQKDATHQSTSHSTHHPPNNALPAIVIPDVSQNTDFSVAERELLQRIIRYRLSSDYSPTPYGLEEQEFQLKRILDTVFKKYQSQSALLVGPRGSGKTLMFRHVLQKYKNAVLLSLNGLLHSDPRTATQQLIKQLLPSNTPIPNFVRNFVIATFAKIF
jgi:hypothetical protein